MVDLIASNGGVIALVVLVARFAAKLIPDSTEGSLGIVRKVLKLLGAYTENAK